MKKRIIAVLFISIFSLPEQGLALSCEEPPPPEIAYDEYDAVVIGTVEEINEGFGGKEMTVKVEKSFKGAKEEIITVKEDPTWGESQLHSSLLFFLNKEGGNWIHPLCSPTTANTDQADEVFADKRELALQEGGIAENNFMDWRLALLLAAISVSVMTAFWRNKRKL